MYELCAVLNNAFYRIYVAVPKKCDSQKGTLVADVAFKSISLEGLLQEASYVRQGVGLIHTTSDVTSLIARQLVDRSRE